MVKLTRYEQETVVNANAEETTATVYTADPVYIRKLDALVEKYPDIYKVIRTNEMSKTYEFPKKLLSFRSPKILTEEQKEICRQRLAAIKKST